MRTRERDQIILIIRQWHFNLCRYKSNNTVPFNLINLIVNYQIKYA